MPFCVFFMSKNRVKSYYRYL